MRIVPFARLAFLHVGTLNRLRDGYAQVYSRLMPPIAAHSRQAFMKDDVTLSMGMVDLLWQMASNSVQPLEEAEQQTTKHHSWFILQKMWYLQVFGQWGK